MGDDSQSADAKIDRLIDEVESMRAELSALHQSVEANKAVRGGAEGAIERAVAEYRMLPDSSEDAFRWGFLGAWGKLGSQGAQHACMSIHTTTIDSFLSTRSEEEVARFAGVFANPDTLRICGCVFRRGGKVSRQDIADDCDLDDGAFLSAMGPLLEWRLVEWKGDWLETCGQGVNYAITLTGMAMEGYKQKSNN